MKAISITKPAPAVQTIQMTGKIWKFQQILAVVLILVGMMTLVVGTAHQGAVEMILGILWFYMVKILIWWNHA